MSGQSYDRMGNVAPSGGNYDKTGSLLPGRFDESMDAGNQRLQTREYIAGNPKRKGYRQPKRTTRK